MYSRQHSPLLLQISSTNALESYHRDIKIHCDRKDGFRATLIALHEVFTRKLSKEDRAVWEQSSKILAEVEQYPDLAKFPLIFQQLIVTELNHAEELLLSDEKPPLIARDYATCNCIFYKRYLLPCKHMFLLDMVTTGGWFTAEIWKKFMHTNQESGFDVYLTYEGRQMEEDRGSPNQVDCDTLDFHAMLDGFRDRFWRLKEVQDVEAMNNFLRALSATLRATQNW
jgi:hypothetical protein